MKCDWEQIDPRIWRCRRCGARVAAALRSDGSLIEPVWENMPPCKGRREEVAIARIEDLAAENPEWAERIAICRECNGLKSCPKCRGCDGVGLWAARIRYGRCEKFAEGQSKTMDFKNFFERVYVINLERRADRLQQFFDGLPKDWPFRMPERWPAVDGKKCPPPPWWSQGSGAWGCYRSHLQIIEKCLNEGVESVLILEDDAICCEGFRDKVQRFLEALPSNWGMLYLGGQHLFSNAHPPERINDQVYRPFNLNRAHAYAIHGGDAMQTIYRHLNATRVWQKRHHIDHHYGLLHERRAIPVYCPAEWLIGQRAGRSNIAGREFQTRFWASASRLTAGEDIEIPPVIAVVGPFRGGTSAVAGVLHHLGISMGANLGGTRWFNPKGIFEAQWLASICREAFREPKMIESKPQAWRVDKLVAWAKSRAKDVGPSKPIGAKHPTLCLMVEDMVKAWPKLSVIAVERPVDEVVASARRVGWLPTAAEVIPMMIRKRDEDLNRLRVRTLRVAYRDLIEHPRETLDRLVEFCDIEPTQDRYAAALEFIDPSLCHFGASEGATA